MDLLLNFTRITSFVIPWGIPLSILILIITIAIDVAQKKFRWSKFGLLLLVVMIALLIIQIKLVYLISGDILNP